MSEPEPTGLVVYHGPPRSMQVGGVYLHPGEEYELPLTTIVRYAGMFKEIDDPVGADNEPRPGQPPSLISRPDPARPEKDEGKSKDKGKPPKKSAGKPEKKKAPKKTTRRKPPGKKPRKKGGRER